MGDKMTILKRALPSVVCSLVLLLGACTTVSKRSLSEERNAVKALVEKVKRLHISPAIAGDELQRADNNLQQADEAAKKGNDIEARKFTEKARSDAEYAKVKVYTVIYKDLMKQREKAYKRYQELNN